MDSIKLSSRGPKVLRGEYLARIAGCETCHTPSSGKKYNAALPFGGGTVFIQSEDIAASSNLTFDETGIGYYNEQIFERAIRLGRVGDHVLMSAMPWSFYNGMTSEDVSCLFAYLRALPHIEHSIDNTRPATYCRKCGNRHGLGGSN